MSEEKPPTFSSVNLEPSANGLRDKAAGSVVSKRNGAAVFVGIAAQAAGLGEHALHRAAGAGGKTRPVGRAGLSE